LDLAAGSWLAFFFGALSLIFQGFGIDINQHYIFSWLSKLEVGNLSIVGAGVLSLLLGVINEFYPRKKRN
jgi:hypothetical protein